MNCQECQELLDSLLVNGPNEAQRAEMGGHLERCPDCAREHALAQEVLNSLGSACTLRASPGLKQRVMDMIADAGELRPALTAPPARRVRRPLLGAAVAALLLIGVGLLVYFGREENVTGFGLLARASAAEANLFAGNSVVHLVSEIIVKPVSDPDWAAGRWFPLVSLEASGKRRFDQLTLPADVGEGYTVEDQCWYDTRTGRFIRLLSVEGRPIWANSYDGQAVYWLEAAEDGTMGIVSHPVAEGFQPPESPESLLGIAAGLQSKLDEKDASRFQYTGDVDLGDGVMARVIESRLPAGGPDELADVHWLFKIRRDDDTIAEMEFCDGEQSLLVVRRAKIEAILRPGVEWDLSNVEKPGSDVPHEPKAGVLANIVMPDVSLEHMVWRADFKVYIFAGDPPWAGDRQIADILDLASPPHRLFAVTYRAKDGRHVVLVQSHSYNTMLGSKLADADDTEPVYESPQGVKVWGGPQGEWLAGILLQSVQGVIQFQPVEHPTGYLLETPAGTFPALAVNGEITDEELHALVDSLAPAKE